ncbi:MAG: lysozyme [Alphaproteobacteria bacterium]|nr:lysozyme [Alphaproteobacteria bacterium]MDN5248933.1 lysozyme [Alphaproteobacteria bacterium]
MTRHINDYCLGKLKEWEGFRAKAYKDSNGIWTIGYGHTAVAGEPAPHEGMSITEGEAETILRRDLHFFEKEVERLVDVPLNDLQFGALVCFAYNVGVGHFKKSDLLKKLNKHEYHEVPIELMKWTKGRTAPIQGLVNRRSNEVAMWNLSV